MYCSCNSSTVISLKWVLVSFFYILNSPKKSQNMKVRCKINYGRSNINFLIMGNAEIRFTFLFYSRRSYRLRCKTFFCTRDTTSWAVIFFVFSPTVTGRKNGFTRVTKLKQKCSKYHICTNLLKSAQKQRSILH